MEIPEFLEQPVLDDFLLGWVKFIEHFDEMLLVNTVKLVFRYLKFFERFEGLIKSVGFAEGVSVGFLELLPNLRNTVLSS
jgi:hypothetical protein